MVLLAFVVVFIDIRVLDTQEKCPVLAELLYIVVVI